MSEAKYTQTWFWPLLAAVFAGLKLAGIIEWSWLWITAPVWLPIVLLTGMWLIGSLILCMLTSTERVFKKLQVRVQKKS